MRVLLVDDEESFLRAMSHFMEHSDTDLLPVADSVEAARHITHQHFDAMIFDIHMPSPDGLELTRLARQTWINHKTPIVLVTGYDDFENRRKGSEAGATCFAGKPVTPKKIRSILQLLQGAVSFDSRSQARLPLRTPVCCRWDSSPAKSLLAESLSLGQNEMLLEPSGGLQVGHEMDLEFRIPSLGRPLIIHAKVSHFEQPDRMAVQFLEVTDRDSEAIQSYITQRLQG